MKNILYICHNIWIKFDANQMSQGLLLTFLPIFFSFLLINNSQVLQLPRIFTTNVILFIYVTNLIFAILGYNYYEKFSMKNEEHSIIFITGLLSTIIFVFFTLQNWSDIAINWSNMKRFSNMPTRLIFVIAVSVFFSNSFIIQEQKILSYLLAALIITMLYEIIQENLYYEMKLRKFKLSTFLKSIIFKLILSGIFAIIMLRCAYKFFRCREEQNDCEDFSQSLFTFSNLSSILSAKTSNRNYNDDNENLLKIISTTKSTATILNENKVEMNLLSIVILVLYTILTRIYLKLCGNLSGYSINVILARYGPIIASISASGYILLLNSNLKYINLSHIDHMAWIVYILFGIQLITVFIHPLMTYVIMPSKTDTTVTTTKTIYSYINIIPELLKRMKQAYCDNNHQDNGQTAATTNEKSSLNNHKKTEIPIVYGLATIYSSTLISFGIFLLLLLVILLNGVPSLGIFICIAVAVVILNIHSILRYRTACKLGKKK